MIYGKVSPRFVWGEAATRVSWSPTHVSPVDIETVELLEVLGLSTKTPMFFFFTPFYFELAK